MHMGPYRHAMWGELYVGVILLLLTKQSIMTTRGISVATLYVYLCDVNDSDRSFAERMLADRQLVSSVGRDGGSQRARSLVGRWPWGYALFSLFASISPPRTAPAGARDGCSCCWSYPPWIGPWTVDVCIPATHLHSYQSSSLRP